MYVKNATSPADTYLLHFQHEGRRVSFKIIVNTDSGENLVSDTKRGVLSRDIRAWNNNAGALQQRVRSSWITDKLKGVAADLSVPGSDTAPPVWGRWICRSCWARWWWRSCCPQRCSYCSIQAAVRPFAPVWGDDPAWWPVCLWTLDALADTAEKKKKPNNNQKHLMLFVLTLYDYSEDDPFKCSYTVWLMIENR